MSNLEQLIKLLLFLGGSALGLLIMYLWGFAFLDWCIAKWEGKK